MDVKIVVETKSQIGRLIEQLRSITDQVERNDERRRARWRLVYAVSGTVDIDDPSLEKTPVYITTRDISLDGIGFLSHEEIPSGRKITLFLDTDFGQVEIVGIVVHCTPTVGMYKIGVKFDLIEPQIN